MAVTIKQIAETCNISRGTVDRVLNNRGKVKAETEELIRSTAAKLGYKPNLAGKALAATKKNYVIGIILISEGNKFYDDVIKGIGQAEQEITDYGIRILLKTMKGYQVEKQLELLDEIKDKINFLIINPINDDRIIDKINQFSEENIKVITINTDVENSARLCHVGCDYKKSGETACGMLGLLTGGEANIGIATGSVKILGHNQRIIGFNKVCREKYPKFQVTDIIETNDDDVCAFIETQKMLQKYPAINAIYIVAAGAYGVCKAVTEAGREKDIIIISSDKTPEIIKLLREGTIKATICQQPWTQGYKTVNMAFQYLVSSVVPEKELHIVKNEIKILQNLK
ncbi:MAG: LacI family transcriptional regulator [Clostridia bacterium]|jgi:LacI family transcriptional regulator|nr:LacI family transcriptional regulator [Clostridia bacterium]